MVKAICYLAYLWGVNAALRVPGAGWREWVLRTLVRAEVGPRCAIGRGVRVSSKGGLSLGTNVNVNAGTYLDARGGLTIGNLVNISPDVMVLTADHDPQSAAFAGRDRAVVIEDRVWLASRAIVLPGSFISSGTVVSAGAVVHGHVPPNVIVAGNPARTIGTRDPGAQTTLKPDRFGY